MVCSTGLDVAEFDAEHTYSPSSDSSTFLITSSDSKFWTIKRPPWTTLPWRFQTIVGSGLRQNTAADQSATSSTKYKSKVHYKSENNFAKDSIII